MVNLKLRLEKVCDSRAWVRLHFGDVTTLTGRVLRVGHDYIEIESYADGEKAGNLEYAKHLVPLNLIKYITVESSAFAEAERRRLDYISELESHDPSMPEYER